MAASSSSETNPPAPPGGKVQRLLDENGKKIAEDEAEIKRLTGLLEQLQNKLLDGSISDAEKQIYGDLRKDKEAKQEDLKQLREKEIILLKQQTQSVHRVGLEKLLKNKGITIDPHVVARMRRRFGMRVLQAVNEQNSEVAAEAYNDTLELPQTSTERQLAIDGITLNGPYYDGSELTICFRGRVTCLLKMLSDKETLRGKAFLDKIGSRTNNFVTEFEIKSVKQKKIMIMPCYISTLERISNLNDADAMTLWSQMSNALGFMHTLGFAHMDVKPSNICLRENGDFVLIDLGSIAKFGEKSVSTTVYLPADMQNRNGTYIASKMIDWWMLTVVYVEKVFGVDIGGSEQTPSKSELLELVNNEMKTFLLTLDDQ